MCVCERHCSNEDSVHACLCPLLHVCPSVSVYVAVHVYNAPSEIACQCVCACACVCFTVRYFSSWEAPRLWMMMISIHFVKVISLFPAFLSCTRSLNMISLKFYEKMFFPYCYLRGCFFVFAYPWCNTGALLPPDMHTSQAEPESNEMIEVSFHEAKIFGLNSS